MPFNFGSTLGRIGSGISNAAGRAAGAIQSAANSPTGQSFRSGLGQVGSAVMPMLASHAGQAIGNRIGGNTGQMISQMGQAFANPYGMPQNQMPQMNAQDYIQQGNQMGQNAINQGQQSVGNALTGAINQYMPQQFQGMNFGNAGSNVGGMATDFLNRYLPQGQGGQPGLGDVLGGMAGHYLNQGIQRYVPQQYQDVNFGDVGNYAAQRGADVARSGLNYGTNYAGNIADRYGLNAEPPMTNRGGYNPYNRAFAHGGYAGGGYSAPRLGMRDFSEMPASMVPSYNFV